MTFTFLFNLEMLVDMRLWLLNDVAMQCDVWPLTAAAVKWVQNIWTQRSRR